MCFIICYFTHTQGFLFIISRIIWACSSELALLYSMSWRSFPVSTFKSISIFLTIIWYFLTWKSHNSHFHGHLSYFQYFAATNHTVPNILWYIMFAHMSFSNMGSPEQTQLLSPYLPNQFLEAIATRMVWKEVSATEKSWQVRWWKRGGGELAGTWVDECQGQDCKRANKVRLGLGVSRLLVGWGAPSGFSEHQKAHPGQPH